MMEGAATRGGAWKAPLTPYMDSDRTGLCAGVGWNGPRMSRTRLVGAWLLGYLG
jgi:hypothetical protein